MERAMLAEFERRDCYKWESTLLGRHYILAKNNTIEWTLSFSGLKYQLKFLGRLDADQYFVFETTFGVVIPVSLPCVKQRAIQRALVVPIARQLSKRLHGVPFEEVAKFLY